MGFCCRRPHGNGALDKRYGVVAMAEMLRQGTQQVERVGLVGIGHKSLAIGRLGLRQPAGLMVGEPL